MDKSTSIDRLAEELAKIAEAECHVGGLQLRPDPLRFGGRCQKHLQPLPCERCAQELSAAQIEMAHEIGAKGGPIVEAERPRFETWMRLSKIPLSPWVVTQYGGAYDDMLSRMLWAAWRDRSELFQRFPILRPAQELRMGGRCEKHLSARPCMQCAIEAKTLEQKIEALVDENGRGDAFERQLFESWMRGHCWKIHDWSDTHHWRDGEFVPDERRIGDYCDMGNALLWACWSARARLEHVAG